MSNGTAAPGAQRLSDKTYVMPFGRYVGSSEIGPPADEVLIGREGQRAYLIDLLISTGRRGAYLVTGRRGAGKTSFVRHCIAEYEANVFSRFLRANVGKGFWDRIFMLSFWLGILVAVLIVSELTQLLVPDPTAPEQHSVLLWLILLPLGVMLLYPCVYAKVVFEAIRQVRPKSRRSRLKRQESQDAGVRATRDVLVAVTVLWILPSFAKPVASMAVAISLVSALYFCCQAFSFHDRWTDHKTRRRLLIVTFWLFILPLIFILMGESNGLMSHKPGAGDLETNLAFAASLLGMGLLLRGALQWSRELSIPHSGTAFTSQDALSITGFVREALASGRRWYLVVGTPLALVGLVRLAISHWKLAAAILIVAILASIPALHRFKASERDTWTFRPRPLWVLTAKALLSILIGLYLAHPILSRMISLLVPQLKPLAESKFDSWLPSQFDLPALLTDQAVFSSRPMELQWLLAMLILTIILSFMEYEWIIRPYLRCREDRAIDPLVPLAPWDDWDWGDKELSPDDLSRDDLESLHRRLAQLTFPWIGYKAWLPVLPVAVNLGFDRLGHRQVIQAMLVGLRQRYHHTFLAWNCGFANFGRLVGLLVLLALTTLIGKLLFSYSPREVTPVSTDDTTELSLTNLVGNLQFSYTPPDQPRATATDALTSAATADRPPPTPQKSIATAKQTHVLSIGSFECNTKKIWCGLLALKIDLPVKSASSDLLLFDLLPHVKETGRVIRIHLFHGILLFLFFFTGRALVARVPVLPYKRNLQRIDDLLAAREPRCAAICGDQRGGFTTFSPTSRFARPNASRSTPAPSSSRSCRSWRTFKRAASAFPVRHAII